MLLLLITSVYPSFQMKNLCKIKLSFFNGYNIAPEYAMWGYLTDKANVYSFGIVALKIINGRSNFTYRPKNECIYHLN